MPSDLKVVGEEGTSLEDFVVYLKGELLDDAYFQQNSFDPMDSSVSPERQKYIFDFMLSILRTKLAFASKDEARSWFNQLRQRFLDWNSSEWQSQGFIDIEKELRNIFAEKAGSEK